MLPLLVLVTIGMLLALLFHGLARIRERWAACVEGSGVATCVAQATEQTPR